MTGVITMNTNMIKLGGVGGLSSLQLDTTNIDGPTLNGNLGGRLSVGGNDYLRWENNTVKVPVAFSAGNVTATNVSTGTLVASTGITTAAILTTGLISAANLAATTSTIPNIVNTNMSTGAINATTVSASTLVSSTITGGNASLSGLLSAPNIVGTNISASTLSAPTITGGNLSLSGNLTIAGTLTTVNITSTNVLQTNVSAGTIASTNATVTNIVGTNISSGTARITTSLISLGNSNTIGNIYTTGGNVGVGTVSPGSSLHVAGSIPVSPVGNGVHMGIDSNTYTVIQLNSTTGSYIDFGTSGGDYQSRIIAGNTGNLSIFTNGASNNGYVGINTVSPAYTLDVTGTGRFTGKLTITGSAGTTGFDTATNDQYADMRVIRNSSSSLDKDMYIQLGAGATSTLHLFSNNSETMTIKSGSVGINTASPAYTLDVNGTSRITNTSATSMGTLIVAGPNSGNPATATSGQLASFYGVGGTNSISNIDFSTFQTTSTWNNLPSVRFSMLDLGSGNSNFNILTRNGGSTGTMASRILIDGSGNIGIGTTAPSGMLHLNNVALFTSTGNLTCTGDVVSFGSLSDRRLKKNIETIQTEKALDIVSKLRAVTFDWKDDIFNEQKRNTSDLGFIAQEVEALVPEAVSEYTQIESGEVYKNIKHERIIPYLLSAIQYLLNKSF